MSDKDIENRIVFFRRLTRADLANLPNLEIDCSNGEVYLIVSEDKIVGAVRYTIKDRRSIKIENINIFHKYRRRGLGTKAILLLRNKFKGFNFYGEILYIIAFEFWSSLKPYLNSSEGLDFFNDDYGCDFSFE